MMIKDKIIVIDLDSTIIDTSKTIIQLNNKVNPDNYMEYNPNHDWNFSPMINTKEELSELFKLFDHKDFYKEDTLVVFPNAIEIINELAEYNRVVICSCHKSSRKPLTTEWINKTLPKIELVFVDDFADKGKLFPNCDIVIDDRIDSLDSFNDDCLKICYGSYIWNKEWNGIRSNSWDIAINNNMKLYRVDLIDEDFIDNKEQYCELVVANSKEEAEDIVSQYDNWGWLCSCTATEISEINGYKITLEKVEDN